VYRPRQGALCVRVRPCKVSIGRRSPPKSGSSCCTPKRCTAARTMAIPSVRSSPISKSSLTGVAIRRIHGDKSYRGHNYPDRFKVWISGQVRRVTKAIRREMRLR
jgi:hypothetical protein